MAATVPAACDHDAGGGAVTTSSFSAGREPDILPQGRLSAAPEASGAAPVSDPSLAGPADGSALMRAAGACWLASAVPPRM
jgi:hypothetical protein